MREYAIILALISAALFAWVLGSEADEIGLRDFAVLTVALIVILAAQALLLSALNKLLKSLAAGQRELMLLVAASILVACNAFFLALYTLEQPTTWRVAYSAAIGMAFLLLMIVPRIRPVLALFGGIMLVMSLAQYGYTRATIGIGGHPTAETVSLPVKSKRNVYLLGFESLQSPTAYRENFGIQELEHVKVLRDLGFRVLDRAYSAERSTLRSYSNIFEFKRQFKGSDLGARGVFLTDNSTFRSFRDSGYQLQVLYLNNYFPVNSNVTYRYPPQGFDACDELGSAYFYGLCNPRLVRLINRYVFRSPKLTWEQQIPLLQRRTDAIVASSRPSLTWTHIKHPFHTHGTYQHPDPKYAADFKRRLHEALPIVARNMKSTAGYIIAKDPNAVVIVIGDHGVHFFRGDENKVKKLVHSNAPLWPLKAIVEDQHGVNFAVYPANFCTNRMSELFSTRRLFENLIACLNGDDSPTEEEVRSARVIRFLGNLQDVREIKQRPAQARDESKQQAKKQ
jgi:hypothetical protein